MDTFERHHAPVCADPSLRYGIGHSGSLDSRLVIYVASTPGVDAHLFTVGDAPSDALHIANRLAHRLEYENHHYPVEANYVALYAYTLVAERPMSPFEACFWLSVRDRLPTFDLVLTGFNGGLIRGAHLEPALRSAPTRDDLYRFLCTSGRLQAVSEMDLAPLLNDQALLPDAYEDFRAHIRRSRHDRMENISDEFEFFSRQLVYIRQSPQFDYLDRLRWRSPYYDDTVVQFACGLTYEERLGERLLPKHGQTLREGATTTAL